MSDEPVSLIASAIKRVYDDESEDQLCASFVMRDCESPWVQIVPGVLNLYWPYEDKPTARLASLSLPEIKDIDFTEWQPCVFATFAIDSLTVATIADLVHQLFVQLYECGDYQLDVEVYAVQDDEIPELIPIAREENYHTHHIGHYGNGKMFMGFVVATLPTPIPDDWKAHKRWYAFLHTFDTDGNHIDTQNWFAGTTEDGEPEVADRAQACLDAMLSGLDGIVYDDIAIRLFSTEIDGHTFGLVDATHEDEEDGAVYVQAELQPNELVFYPPWQGVYDT